MCEKKGFKSKKTVNKRAKNKVLRVKNEMNLSVRKKKKEKLPYIYTFQSEFFK